MDAQTLETLRDGYPTSSWALWSADFPESGCIEEDSGELYEFIKKSRGQLRPSIALLSLNPSTHLPENYQNFHATDPKHRNEQFRDLVEEAGLSGAYMTDLVERIVEHDSSKVDPKNKDVDNLLEQLDLLNQDQYYTISFFSEVFQMLKTSLNSRERELPHNIRGFAATHEGR